MARSATDIHPKVVAGTFGGGLSVILVWILGVVGVDVPAEVASAITALISGLFGYLQPSDPGGADTEPLLPDGPAADDLGDH